MCSPSSATSAGHASIARCTAAGYSRFVLPSQALVRSRFKAFSISVVPCQRRLDLFDRGQAVLEIFRQRSFERSCEMCRDADRFVHVAERMFRHLVFDLHRMRPMLGASSLWRSVTGIPEPRFFRPLHCPLHCAVEYSYVPGSLCSSLLHNCLIHPGFRESP